jgi:AcrR family transcriptional regulator
MLDPRIARTKQMLRDALMQLIEEKGFDSITVRDLTSRAGLNRGTFYLHYRDKFDLMEQSKEEVWRELSQLVQRADPLLLYQYSQRDEASPFVIDIFEFIAANADFFKVMLGPKAFPQRIITLIREHIYDQFLQLQLSEENMLVPRDYLLAFITSAHLGVVQLWLAKGLTLPPTEIALMISRIIRLGPLQTTGIANVVRSVGAKGNTGR